MEKNKIFVGSLPWSINNDSLKELFSVYGEIVEVNIISDRDTGRSKGFGFITFKNEDDAKKALEMHNREVEGRTIVVNMAKPRVNRNN